jgi:hypothetical protein
MEIEPLANPSVTCIMQQGDFVTSPQKLKNRGKHQVLPNVEPVKKKKKTVRFEDQ